MFILASLHLAGITGVPHSWLNGSTGVPAVPATISMSVLQVHGTVMEYVEYLGDIYDIENIILI